MRLCPDASESAVGRLLMCGDKGRQMSSRYIPADKTTERSEKSKRYMTSKTVSSPIRITKHRRRTTNRFRDMLDFRIFAFCYLPCLRKSLNSVKTLVRHFKCLLASTPLIIRHARHFSSIWVMYHCHIFVFSSHLF